MSSTEDKHPKKSKRSFIPKLPSFRRKKNQQPPDGTPTKSTPKPKKQNNENSSNGKGTITKVTQTPQRDVTKHDKSTSRIVDDYTLAVLREEQNGNPQGKNQTGLSNLNTTSVYTSSTTTSFTNPEYQGDVWTLQNANSTTRDEFMNREINANLKQKSFDSPTHSVSLSPSKTSPQHLIDRPSSIASALSSSSSLSLSSPGSLSKLIGGPKPYRSVFSDEPRGVKRQGSTPSDVEFGSSCVSVSGSVSSLSPTVDDVATKVTVRCGSVPGLAQYPLVTPVESLSPGLSPKHKHGSSKREGAYTYDSSGWESEDSSKNKTLTRESYDVSAAQDRDGDSSPTSLVNLNFDLQAAATASPQININVRRDRRKERASSREQRAVEENTHKLVSEQQEDFGKAGAGIEEALISQSSAAAPSGGLVNNNPQLESKRGASSPQSKPCSDGDLRSTVQTRSEAAHTTPPRSQPNNATPTAARPQEKTDQVMLTRVTSVTSPSPVKTPRTFYSPRHLQLSAMRNKLRSESFDSSDLDSLASDDLMCEADTFVDQSDESLLAHGPNMPGEQGFSPYPNSAKGKRLRNNSIEFLVATFDKRHRHHSTGQTYGAYATSPRGNLRTPGGVRDTMLVEASTYRQMVQDLNSMKTALVRLSKMLQDPKALSEMLAVCQQGKEPEPNGSMAQCEQGKTQAAQAQTESQASLVSRCEAASQSEVVQKETKGVQSDPSITGCKQCQHRSSPRKQDDPDIIPDRAAIKGSGYRSRENCLSISSSSSAGDEECLREPWKGSSGLDQGALSPLSHSSCDDTKYLEKSQSTKVHRKHVRISDVSSDGSSTSRLHTPTQRVSSSPKLQRTRFSSSDEGSKVSGHRLKYRARVDSRGRKGSAEVVKELSSSDDGQDSRSRAISRSQNPSDSSNDGSEDSGNVPEKSRLPQVRRPPSRMLRPRQVPRPRASHQRKPDGQGGVEPRGIPAVSRSQRSKDFGHQDQPKANQEQVDQTDLGWQQMQLQQQQDKRHKQQVAARKQQQENQQRLFNQQQQLQKERQEQAAANIQRQQEILVEQQQQQLKRHQMQQLQQQKSLESASPKSPHPQAAILKRSSQQDLASAQKKRAEMVAAKDMRHSSPDLIDNRLSETVHSDRHAGLDSQRPGSKSRLLAPSAVSRLPMSRQISNPAAKSEGNSPSHTTNNTNGIPVPKSKMSSPMPAKRGIPTGRGSSIQRQSPPAERRIPGPAGNQRLTGTPIHTNQNNNPQLSHQSTTFTTTTTTITTTVMPQTSSSTQPSRLPSPSKSIQKPVSRLAQPKVKVQSRIPKTSGIPTRGRDAN